MLSLIRIAYLLFCFYVLNLNKPFYFSNVFRNQSATQIKGIASILILMGHCTVRITSFDISFINIGFICVAIFYFWSGYGVAYGCSNKQGYLHNYWKNRFIKVLVPFALAHLLYIPLKAFFGIRFGISDILSSFLGMKEIVDYSWYCTSILVFYFVFWISAKARAPRVQCGLVLLGTILVTAVEMLLIPESEDWWFISNLAFAAGVFFANYQLEKKRLLHILCFSVLVCLGSIVMIPLFKRIWGYYSYPVNVISYNLMSCAAAVTAIILFGMRCTENRILGFLGNISYEIYLLHGLFIYIFTEIHLPDALLIPATIAAVIPSAYLFHQINLTVFRKLHHLK